MSSSNSNYIYEYERHVNPIRPLLGPWFRDFSGMRSEGRHTDHDGGYIALVTTTERFAAVFPCDCEALAKSRRYARRRGVRDSVYIVTQQTRPSFNTAGVVRTGMTFFPRKAASTGHLLGFYADEGSIEKTVMSTVKLYVLVRISDLLADANAQPGHAQLPTWIFRACDTSLADVVMRIANSAGPVRLRGAPGVESGDEAEE